MSKIKLLIISLSFLAFSCGYFSPKNQENNFDYNDEINMQFVEGSQDIPLAKGLRKIDEDSLTFDSVGGNVISVSYKALGNLQEIRNFYLTTLPQMGWVIARKKQSLGMVDFKRENEKLEIKFVNKNGHDLVEFYGELGI